MQRIRDLQVLGSVGLKREDCADCSDSNKDSHEPSQSGRHMAEPADFENQKERHGHGKNADDSKPSQGWRKIWRQGVAPVGRLNLDGAENSGQGANQYAQARG
jgi:hypothetical protein